MTDHMQMAHQKIKDVLFTLLCVLLSIAIFILVPGTA